MSITINAPLTTSDGGTIPSGGYILFETNFPAGEFIYIVDLKIYRSQQAYIDGYKPVRSVKEIPSLNFQNNLTLESFTALTPSIIHNEVKAHLEQYLGVNTVVVNQYS